MLIETKWTNIKDVMYHYYGWVYIEMVIYCQSKWERGMCLIRIVCIILRGCIIMKGCVIQAVLRGCVIRIILRGWVGGLLLVDWDGWMVVKWVVAMAVY